MVMRLLLVGFALLSAVFDARSWPLLDQRLAIGSFVWLVVAGGRAPAHLEIHANRGGRAARHDTAQVPRGSGGPQRQRQSRPRRLSGPATRVRPDLQAWRERQQEHWTTRAQWRVRREYDEDPETTATYYLLRHARASRFAFAGDTGVLILRGTCGSVTDMTSRAGRPDGLLASRQTMPDGRGYSPRLTV
jgi:hypothetical protein